MLKRLFLRFGSFFLSWRVMFSEELLALLLVLFVLIPPVSASTRFTERGLFMASSRPGDVTSYTVSLRYITMLPVGSVDMLFCINPIPYEPCVTPPGLDVSNTSLVSQSGETGFSITAKSQNHIVISRGSTMLSSPELSSYTFDNIVNPTDSTTPFSIRLASYSSEDATGPLIDFGSVRGEITDSITLETQVPPMLVFCLAQEVELGCKSTNRVYFEDLGDVDLDKALFTQSQMAVGTNATAGFVIVVDGDPPTAGTKIIPPNSTPVHSIPGSNQFGINLVANLIPEVGIDPEGTWANAEPTSDYGVPDLFKFKPGDVVASSPNVSLMKKFTVSYVLNVSPSLDAGVYTTTITFIASGRF